MKKVLLSLSVILLTAGAVSAQSHEGHDHGAKTEEVSSTLNIDDMYFEEDAHNFGTIPEGPGAEVVFRFENRGKEPIVLQQVRPSCGCTTPSYSKDPVLPGKVGEIKAIYNTKGRPGGFTKSITVTSNAGTKVLTIKGEVEAAPASSVPANGSMMKKS